MILLASAKTISDWVFFLSYRLCWIKVFKLSSSVKSTPGISIGESLDDLLIIEKHSKGCICILWIQALLLNPYLSRTLHLCHERMNITGMRKKHHIRKVALFLHFIHMAHLSTAKLTWYTQNTSSWYWCILWSAFKILSEESANHCHSSGSLSERDTTQKSPASSGEEKDSSACEWRT